eukprot:590875-Prorocentrum_lima.AAC.1
MDLGKGLRFSIKSHVVSEQFGRKYRSAWKVDDTATEETEGGAVPTSFEEWVESLARPGKYVDGLCLTAMARRLQRRIVL